MMISLEGFDELHERLTDRSLGMQAVRVLVAMVKTVERDNIVRAGRKDLARMLEMDQSDVSKAMKSLIEAGFIERPKLRFDPYRISPRFAWRGSTTELKRALHDRGMLDARGMMKSRQAAA